MMPLLKPEKIHPNLLGGGLYFENLCLYTTTITITQALVLLSSLLVLKATKKMTEIKMVLTVFVFHPNQQHEVL